MSTMNTINRSMDMNNTSMSTTSTNNNKRKNMLQLRPMIREEE